MAEALRAEPSSPGPPVWQPWLGDELGRRRPRTECDPSHRNGLRSCEWSRAGARAVVRRAQAPVASRACSRTLCAWGERPRWESHHFARPCGTRHTLANTPTLMHGERRERRKHPQHAHDGWRRALTKASTVRAGPRKRTGPSRRPRNARGYAGARRQFRGAGRGG